MALFSRWMGMLALVVGFTCGPAHAWKSKEQKKAECAARVAVKSEDRLLQKLADAEEQLLATKAILNPLKLSYDIPALQNLSARIDEVILELYGAIDQLQEPDAEKFRKKAQRFHKDVSLWKERLDTSALTPDPQLVMFDRVYKVDTERGGEVSVRLSQELSEEFFWALADRTRNEAARLSLTAIRRGYLPPGEKRGDGIAIQREVNGFKIVKIHIVGRAVGAYRVYGCIRSGVIDLVHFAHESDHGDRYQSRVFAQTAAICSGL